MPYWCGLYWWCWGSRDLPHTQGVTIIVFQSHEDFFFQSKMFWKWDIILRMEEWPSCLWRMWPQERMSSRCLSTSSGTEAIFSGTEDHFGTIFVWHWVMFLIVKCHNIFGKQGKGRAIIVINYAVKSGCERPCASSWNWLKTHPVPLVWVEILLGGITFKYPFELVKSKS